uniref:Autophagy-related protein 27 n=1 Tax=Vannella robusta TaxID=1487602 RepID=A0A7S4I053_9EUKA|mmetsp:Transcript_1832/g.2278  ORF Transcript_1832/g.2278 Transcript_1832/m.2278 type:complete len:257 (+) Transcript_1832:72-842(+)
MRLFVHATWRFSFLTFPFAMQVATIVLMFCFTFVINGCLVANEKATWNITSLAYNPGEYAPKEFYFGGAAGGNQYYINFCKPVSQKDLKKCHTRGGDSLACQQGIDGTFHSAGRIALNVPYQKVQEGQQGVAIQYVGGDYCPLFGKKRTTTIHLTCDPSVPTILIEGVTEDRCDYTIRAKSQYACASRFPSLVRNGQQETGPRLCCVYKTADDFETSICVEGDQSCPVIESFTLERSQPVQHCRRCTPRNSNDYRD